MKPKITFCNRHGKWMVQVKDQFTYFVTYAEAINYASAVIPKSSG